MVQTHFATKYDSAKPYLVYGLPRCPSVTPSGLGKPVLDDHYIGQSNRTCNVCKGFVITDEWKNRDVFSVGSIWRWMRARNYIAIRIDGAIHRIDGDYVPPADALVDLGDAASATTQALVGLAEAMQPDPNKSRVPVLVQRRWAEDRKGKRRRNAG